MKLIHSFWFGNAGVQWVGNGDAQYDGDIMFDQYRLHTSDSARVVYVSADALPVCEFSSEL